MLDVVVLAITRYEQLSRIHQLPNAAQRLKPISLDARVHQYMDGWCTRADFVPWEDLEFLRAEPHYFSKLSSEFELLKKRKDVGMAKVPCSTDVWSPAGGHDRFSTVAHYQYPCGVSSALIRSVLGGAKSTLTEKLRVETYFRWRALIAVEQSHMETVAVGWCLAIVALAGIPCLRPMRGPFWDIWGFDREQVECSGGEDVFHAYINYMTGRLMAQKRWLSFVRMQSAVVGTIYGRKGWRPPRFCFHHSVCPHLPAYPPPGVTKDNRNEWFPKALRNFWAECTPSCGCRRSDEDPLCAGEVSRDDYIESVFVEPHKKARGEEQLDDGILLDTWTFAGDVLTSSSESGVVEVSGV